MSGNLDLEAIGQSLEIGSAVRLKDRFLKNKDYKEMGPRVLLKVGWPNVFYVERVAVDPKEGPVISLSACCCNLLLGAGWRCKYHPAYLFEELDLEKIKPEFEGEDRPARESKPGDRSASVVTLLGEVASFEYHEDETDPGLIIKILGRKFELNGMIASHLYKAAKERGIV